MHLPFSRIVNDEKCEEGFGMEAQEKHMVEGTDVKSLKMTVHISAHLYPISSSFPALISSMSFSVNVSSM